MSGNRRNRGEMQLYNPPPMRRLQQEREKKRLEEEEEEKKRTKEKQERQRKAAVQELTRSPTPPPPPPPAEKRKKRAAAAGAPASDAAVSAVGSSEECASSDCSVSGRVVSDASSNLSRFLECTAPVVPAQYLPRTSVKGWRTREPEYHPYFVLSDLWDSFEEWSVYGVGVPLLLHGSDPVIQYYAPYLSGIQLYADPSRPGTEQRRAGEDSDGESPRETTSSDESADCGAESCCSNVVQSLNRISLEDKPFVGSSSDESEISSSPGHLIFEYMEHDTPFGREPLADKISKLASRFPALRTHRSCDLSPFSWVSVAWYPIYRIPMGPTLQNLETCFLTFHRLSTPMQGTCNNGGPNLSNSGAPLQVPLPTFGLASYRFNVSDWSPDGVPENQDSNSLLQAADDWLRRLQVAHPDFRFFVSHNNAS